MNTHSRIASPPASFLSLEGVCLGYDTPAGLNEIVRDCSVTLARGEIACLLGPSGCGKSTILRAIAGFEPLRAGAIRLNGKTLATPRTALAPERRNVGMVFQDYALFPHLTVAQNIAFGLRGQSRRERDKCVARMLELVGLPLAGAAWPHELSGGQQQRVALARALAPAPQLLLLDEPFSSLDSDLRERLATEVRDILRALNHTAILVTHNMAEAQAMATRIGTMAPGRPVQWVSCA
ncbi:ABC transporter [Lampropedia cohaerens]|uniref:ABC transporter n=1 Tax=Lampropedia cohaerens TaxID=1610491 RepID=A0A0U1Q058_9BURK|nr:ABC transporter ATP-binding protein [Lampropedia cohaerens]KKW68142.1 ABC transporter [Lampropedia cohaerens]